MEVSAAESEAATRMTEHRTARRYNLSLSVLIRLPMEKEPASRTGRVRDISSRGVYFSIDSDLGKGDQLDLTMTLPAEVTAGARVLIRAIGKVVRVDAGHANRDHLVGVAAVIVRYVIVRDEAAVA